MELSPNENFFEVTVSQEGAERIFRLYKVVKWVFACSIVLSALYLTTGILRYVISARFAPGREMIFKIESVVNYVYVAVGIVLMIGQLYSFFHFTRLCKKSIQLRQADLFNYSFKWLLRSALFSLSIMVAQFLVGSFTIFAQIYLLS